MDPRAGWPLGRQIQMSPHIAPRPIEPAGGAVDVRMYSDAYTSEDSAAAVALFRNELAVELGGRASDIF